MILGERTWQFAKLWISSLSQTSCVCVCVWARHFPTSRVLALGQVHILMSTMIYNYSSNIVYMGVQSLWKKLEIMILYNVHHGKSIIILWYSNDGIHEARVRDGNRVGQDIRFSMFSWRDIIIIVVIHTDLNLPLQISHTPCHMECGKLFWLRTHNALHLLFLFHLRGLVLVHR